MAIDPADQGAERTKKPRSNLSDQQLNAVVFATIVIVGGGNPVGVAVAVDELDPLWAAAARFIAAGAIFAIGMAFLRIPIPHGRALLGSLVYGVLGFFAAFALIFWDFSRRRPGQVRSSSPSCLSSRWCWRSPTGSSASAFAH